MRYFTTYWKNETWDRHSSSTARHTASNQYRARGIRPGDTIYITTIRAGQLYVGSRLVVGRVVDRESAVKHFHEPDLWDAADHILAKKAEPFFTDCAVPVQTARRLRFLPEGRLAFKTRDQIDQQTLRGVRELTADSARLLDQVLRKFKGTGAPASPKGQALRHWRADPRAAATVFDRLFGDLPDPDRKICLEFLAESIRRAAAVAPNAWAVTLQPDLVRLNVAGVERVIFYEGGLGITAAASPSGLKRASQGGTYATAAGALAIRFPYVEAATNLPKLREPHDRTWSSVGHKVNQKVTQAAHSPGVIRYLNTTLGIRLPESADDVDSSERSDPPFTSSGEEAGYRQWDEGNRVRILVDRAERSPQARAACIKIHGLGCQVCGMSFDERYGELGEGFIHVHHRQPLAGTDTARRVDPVKDLVPVCANCHAMLHRKDPPFTVEQLRQLLIADKALRPVE